MNNITADLAGTANHGAGCVERLQRWWEERGAGAGLAFRLDPGDLWRRRRAGSGGDGTAQRF